MSENQVKNGTPDGGYANWLEIVREQVASLKYGVVEIVVHDSQVTQIEKTEKLRLDKPASRTPAAPARPRAFLPRARATSPCWPRGM